jgi:hypothetical protein
MPGLDTFEIPKSLDEAETLRAQLTNDVQSIQAQLGDKQRTDEEGRRLTSKEYWAWKKRAQHALNQKLDELRFIKNWIRERRHAMTAVGIRVDHPPPVEEALGHLRALCTLLDSLRLEDVDFDPEETTQIDAAREFLVRVGVPIQTTAA